jgi:hypothetical protein
MLIFRILMGTRRQKLTPEHVGALNLIEVEFYREPIVLDKLRSYIDNLNSSPELSLQWLTRADVLFSELVQSIGRKLGYNIEQLHVFQGGYYPRGLGDIDIQQQHLRTLAIELLEGHRAVPISVPAAQSAPNAAPPSRDKP